MTKFYNGVSWDAPSAQAETSATNALASENAAASSASAAAASESNAASSASAAATSETNAASSASAASTSESNAATSESNASTSESNAASSASTALSHKNDAASSAGTAAAQVTLAQAEVATASQHADRAQSAADALVGVANDDVLAAIESYGIANILGLCIIDTTQDRDPTWIYRSSQYQWGRPVSQPTGVWLGAHANVAAAVAAGGVEGDYYWSSADVPVVIDAGEASGTVVTEGIRARFPQRAIAVLYARTPPGHDAALVIFDADTPDLPMWRYTDAEIAGGGALEDLFWAASREISDRELRYSNGVLAFFAEGDTNSGGMLVIDFIRDRFARHSQSGLGGHADGVYKFFQGGNTSLAANKWTAAEALGNRRTYAVAFWADPHADPEERPVIAVGGHDNPVEIILPDDTVLTCALSGSCANVDFLDDGTLIWHRANTLYAASPATWRTDNFSPDWSTPLNATVSSNALRAAASMILAGTSSGLELRTRGQHPAHTLRARLAGDHVLPWCPAEDTVLAIGGETAVDDLVGGNLTTLTGTGSDSITTVVGGLYKIEVTWSGRTTGYLGVQWEGPAVGAENGASDTFTTYRYATETPSSLQLIAQNSWDGTISAVSVTRVAIDRSRAGNHAEIVGTVARSAFGNLSHMRLNDAGDGDVLEIADLLDASDDWSLTTYLRGDGLTSGVAWAATFTFGGDNVYLLHNAVAEVLELRVGTTTTATSPYATATAWRAVTIQRKGSTAELWVDGELAGSAAFPSVGSGAYDLTLGDTRTGNRNILMAHVHVATRALTPDEIRQAHAMLVSAHEGNPTLLTDAVDAVAHDASRDLIYASGPSGTTVLRGSTLARETTYTDADANLTSANHDAVAAQDGILVIGSAAEARIELPALPLREHLTAPREAVSDATTIQTAGTTDATPTVIAAIPVAEGEIATYEILVRAYEAHDLAGEAAQYRVPLTARRAYGGNVTLLGTPTVTADAETTGSMDLTVAADTSAQLVELTATGVASTDLTWETEIRRVR